MKRPTRHMFWIWPDGPHAQLFRKLTQRRVIRSWEWLASLPCRATKPEGACLTQEDYWMIQELHQQGVYQGEIAENLGVNRKTFGRTLKRGGPPSRVRRPKGTPSSGRT